jgi:hypothetical protein
MAFQIFNVSIDMPDGTAQDVPEDLSINEQESVVELILEKGLGYEDAIAERDEPGDESQNFELNKDFKMNVNHYAQITFNIISTEYIQRPYKVDFNSEYLQDITPPPPKA